MKDLWVSIRKLAVFDKEAFDNEIMAAMRRYWELKPFYQEVWSWRRKDSGQLRN